MQHVCLKPCSCSACHLSLPFDRNHGLPTPILCRQSNTAISEHPLVAFVGMQDRTSPPDVWLQILGHCARYAECQPEVIKSLSQQLANEQQQRLEANSLLQLHQQQLDAVTAEAAELRGRLAAVEGQLQQLLACLPQRG